MSAKRDRQSILDSNNIKTSSYDEGVGTVLCDMTLSEPCCDFRAGNLVTSGFGNFRKLSENLVN